MDDNLLPIKTIFSSDGLYRYDLFLTKLVRDDGCIASYCITASGDNTVALLSDIDESYGKACEVLEKLCECSVSPLHISQIFDELY